MKLLSSRIKTSCSAQLADSVIPCSHLASIHRASKRANFKERRCCKCRAVIVRRAGLPCTRMTLTLSVYHAWENPTLMLCSAGLIALCESFSLAFLHSMIAFFSKSCEGPVRKKQQGRGFEQPVTSELASAQCPHVSLSQREQSPVLFTQLDQRPSAAASDIISFVGSDNELDIDSLSLAASDAEELSGSVAEPALLPASASCSARLKADNELIRVMSKAVNELGLEWSLPEEPSRSRLDECFFLGHHQDLHQRLFPFFPEVHNELTKSWRAPYSSRIRPSTSAALTSVDLTLRATKATAQAIGRSMSASLCWSAPNLRRLSRQPN